MAIGKIRRKLRADLESPPTLRRLGTGWLSGVAALVAAAAGLMFVLCLRYPTLLTVPPLREARLKPTKRVPVDSLKANA
jgi:hypothetical protein